MNTQPTGCRVLVVDDNVDAAETLAELLRLHGHEVVTAHCGPDAITSAQAYCPEAVFLDLGLRGLDGYAVARQLQAMDSKARPRLLVAVTGYGTEEDRIRSRSAGFDAHLVKPVDPSEYLTVLQSAMPSDPA
jgi:CheY-like chemotaxis protein